MAHLQYLVFNNENIPMPASYSVSLSDKAWFRLA